jgi:FkbM family methyltransferase
MKKFIKFILNQFDLDIRRKSLYERGDDPIKVLEILFESIGLKTIIDGGASIGTLAQRFSDTFPDARVHAFEPYQPHFDALQEVADNNKRIIPVKKGLSNRNGTRSFFQNQSSGTNSFLQAAERGQAIYGDQLKGIGQTQAECISLDHYLQENKIQSVDILKLDLQGGEADALDGASKSLAAGKIKCVLCEVMFEKHYEEQPSAGKLLNSLLEDFDLTLVNFYQSNYHRGRIIYSDVLLFHPSLFAEIEKNAINFFHAHSRLPIIS